jgi:predicted aminopeptidase
LSTRVPKRHYFSLYVFKFGFHSCPSVLAFVPLSGYTMGMRIGRPALSGLLLLSLFTLNGCYLLSQGVFLLSYTGRAQDIRTVLERNNLDPPVRRMLEEVLTVQEFAVRELGLAKNRNYTRYADTGKEYLVSVVTASMDDSFTPFTWRFPIVGEVPYKGFYRPEDALKLARRLKKKNYDVIVRPVDAFSTLGVLADPVYDFMSDYSSFQLAELIIHEQTHATIFVKSRIQFNEELATFVGYEGALRYISVVKGETGELNAELERAGKDRNRFLELMRELYRKLDEVYSSPRTRSQKLTEKSRILNAFQTDIRENYDDYFLGEGFRFLIGMEINNAYILSWNIYSRDLSLYYEVYDRFGRDLGRFIEALKPLETYKGDPKEYLASLLL